MNPFYGTDFSISDSLKTVRKSVLIYETIIDINAYFEQTTELVKTWIEHMQGQLDGEAETRLQSQIDALKYMYVKGTTLYMPQTMASVSNGVLSIGTLDEGGTE